MPSLNKHAILKSGQFKATHLPSVGYFLVLNKFSIESNNKHLTEADLDELAASMSWKFCFEQVISVSQTYIYFKTPEIDDFENEYGDLHTKI